MSYAKPIDLMSIAALCHSRPPVVRPLPSASLPSGLPPSAYKDYQVRHCLGRATKSDGELNSRRGLGKIGASRRACRLTQGFHNRLCRDVFTNAQTAAKEDNVAFVVDGFVGDKHL